MENLIKFSFVNKGVSGGISGVCDGAKDQVTFIQPGDELTLNEIKTKKPRRINLNKAIIAAIQPLSKHIQDNGQS